MKVFLVLTPDHVKTLGCFKTKKDCRKYTGGNKIDYVIKKLKVETYEPKKKLNASIDYSKKIDSESKDCCFIPGDILKNYIPRDFTSIQQNIINKMPKQDFQKEMLEADKELQKVCKKPKEYIVDIDNHVCCESCNEIYLTTIDCPICEDSIAIELDDKEGECDCGIKFNLHKNERYEMILTIK